MELYRTFDFFTGHDCQSVWVWLGLWNGNFEYLSCIWIDKTCWEAKIICDTALWQRHWQVFYFFNLIEYEKQNQTPFKIQEEKSHTPLHNIILWLGKPCQIKKSYSQHSKNFSCCTVFHQCVIKLSLLSNKYLGWNFGCVYV